MTHRLLFVCHANIARSAAATLLARWMLGPHSDCTAAGAGTHALAGHPIATDIGAALHRRGIGVFDHAGHQATVGDIDAADTILTFERVQRAWILDAQPAAVRKTFTIRRAAQVLAAGGSLTDDTATYTADDDFDDPFGRGAAVAEQAVDDIDGLLRVILPGLGAVAADTLPARVTPRPTRRSTSVRAARTDDGGRRQPAEPAAR